MGAKRLWKHLCPNFGDGQHTHPSLEHNGWFIYVYGYSCHLRQVVGSREAALETVLVLRQVVSKARFSNIDQLVSLIRSVGKRLVEAQPKGVYILRDQMEILTRISVLEHSVGNTVRKLLHHIREEYNTAMKANASTSKTVYSISTFVLQGQPRKQNAAAKSEATLVLKEDDPDGSPHFVPT